jgi:hypothetical protein
MIQFHWNTSSCSSLFQTKSHKQQRTPLALEDLQALLRVTVNKLA